MAWMVVGAHVAVNLTIGPGEAKRFVQRKDTR